MRSSQDDLRDVIGTLNTRYRGKKRTNNSYQALLSSLNEGTWSMSLEKGNSYPYILITLDDPSRRISIENATPHGFICTFTLSNDHTILIKALHSNYHNNVEELYEFLLDSHRNA